MKNQKELVLLVGLPGSGKTTYCRTHLPNHFRISQDDHGKEAHKILFEDALNKHEKIVIDRLNHRKDQRELYISKAKEQNYAINIVWLKSDKELCERRILNRTDHPTIDPKKDNVRAILDRVAGDMQTPTRNECDSLLEVYIPFNAIVQDLTHLKGKILVIGDTHGVYEETMNLINKNSPDYVVFTGDLNDRGPDYIKLLSYVRNNNNVFTVEGNHENKLARALRYSKVIVSNGLDVTLSALKDYTTEQKLELSNWIKSLPTIIELPGKKLVVHAGFDPIRNIRNQNYTSCIYIRTLGGKTFSDDNYPFWFEHEFCEELSNHTILFGHNSHSSVQVRENVFSLDGDAVYGGHLRGYLYNTENPNEYEIVTEKCKQYYDPYTSTSTELHGFFDEREKLCSEGLLTKSIYKNLILYNYTDKCTFDKQWNEHTINSRGTIYNKVTGEVVALAFPKFFNLGENESTKMENLPDLPFQVMEKLDGSLGILYRYGGHWRVATRGSFYSDQAERATKMLSKYDMSGWPPGWTPLCEIIYPENRILVPYGDREELVLLAARNIKTGEYMRTSELRKHACAAKFTLPKSYNLTLPEMVESANTMSWQEEGYVIRYSNGLMVKIKGKDYLRIAKVKNHLSPLTIWEAMMEEKINEYLIGIPEEILPDAQKIVDDITSELNCLESAANTYINSLNLENVNYKDKEEAKRAAIGVSKAPSFLKPYLFLVMRKSADKKTLLKFLRPNNNVYVKIEDLFTQETLN